MRPRRSATGGSAAVVVGVAVLAALGLACAGGAAGPAGERAVQLRLARIATGLESPVHVAAAPGEAGRLYIVEQPGRIRIFERGRLRAQPFLDITRIVRSGGEQGLFAVAFHPRYAQNRRFYVHYSDLNGHTRLAEYRSNGQRALTGSRRQIFFTRQPYANHNGGQIAFGPDGRLYLGLGDGGAGADPEDRAQNLASPLGKLWAFDVDRSPVRRRIAAYGLRNPWRFSFDRATGDLYIGDVGQSAWEEVDYLPRRLLSGLTNYGWDVYEGRARFENKEPRGSGRLVFPIVVMQNPPHCSVVGGFVYRGRALGSAARGRYFYGDFCEASIRSLRVSGGKATTVRGEGVSVPNLSSFGEDARGELYAVSLSGSVFKLVR